MLSLTYIQLWNHLTKPSRHFSGQPGYVDPFHECRLLHGNEARMFSNASNKEAFLICIIRRIVCFGRLVSTRRISVLCISKFQSRKPNNCWLWKYKFGKKRKSCKNFKNTFLHDGCSTNLVHKTEFLNLGFCSIFFQFWNSVRFVTDYSVLVGRHTIF